MHDGLLKAYNIADLRALARRRLPKGVFEFVDRGAEDEVSLRNNRAALERIKLKPRTLVDVSKRSQAITLFGKPQKMPVAIAPTGFAGLLWYHGEIDLARAAKAAGIPFTVATNSLTALEKIADEVGGTLWFQLYVWQDRAQSYKLVERAQAAGYQALIVSVDGAVMSNREYNKRNHFGIPMSYTARNVTDVLMHPRWFLGVLARYVMTTGMPHFENYPSELKNRVTQQAGGGRVKNDPALNWEDLRTLRKMWPRTLIVKGILNPQDALLAADCGADAVVVSNHGGRNLDSTMAPIEVLPEIVDAAGKRLTILVDSGFQRGSDIVKALALGAQAVLLGRSTLYGIAVGGEAGAARALALFREEIDRVLALLGCCNVADLARAHVRVPADMEVRVSSSRTAVERHVSHPAAAER